MGCVGVGWGGGVSQSSKEGGSEPFTTDYLACLLSLTTCRAKGLQLSATARQQHS
jgi:hypothetical protein